MIQLKDEMLKRTDDMLDDMSRIETIKFLVFLFIALLIFVIVWYPYLKSLNNKIWRTKGMLNMIPMDIIMRNERLR